MTDSSPIFPRRASSYNGMVSITDFGRLGPIFQVPSSTLAGSTVLNNFYKDLSFREDAKTIYVMETPDRLLLLLSLLPGTEMTREVRPTVTLAQARE